MNSVAELMRVICDNDMVDPSIRIRAGYLFCRLSNSFLFRLYP